MSDETLAPHFFLALARELVGEVVIAGAAGASATSKTAEERVAQALADAFESGLSSSLVGVVTAIEAVRVPPNGLVAFKFPRDMSERSVAALRRDLLSISDALAARLGHKPILIVLPETIGIEAVEFAESNETPDFAPERESSPIGQTLGSEPIGGTRRIVALDHLRLQALIRGAVRSALDIPGEDPIESVTVLPMGSTVADGVAAHDIRVTLPAAVASSVSFGGASVGDAVHEVLAAFAKETGARFKVTILPHGLPTLHPATFTFEP